MRSVNGFLVPFSISFQIISILVKFGCEQEMYSKESQSQSSQSFILVTVPIMLEVQGNSFDSASGTGLQ